MTDFAPSHGTSNWPIGAAVAGLRRSGGKWAIDGATVTWPEGTARMPSSIPCLGLQQCSDCSPLTSRGKRRIPANERPHGGPATLQHAPAEKMQVKPH